MIKSKATEEIALAQTYFAIQTRKQEIQGQRIEDGKRVYLRNEMKELNRFSPSGSFELNPTGFQY